jgi:hypothetical protein
LGKSSCFKQEKDGSFTADVNLPKGTQHEFKYRVDETVWINEPEADSEQPNVYGGINSVLVV